MTISKFINSAVVKFRGGRGGDGCISMLSLFANEFAGPSGGNGGHGGHIVLRAKKSVKSLNHIQSQYRGHDGIRGRSKNLFGANAEHTFVDVPVGTVVARPKPKELAEHEFDPELSDLVADLDQDGSLFIAAKGGSGGRGNNAFLSNTNRHPRIAEAGAKGEENVYELRMKLYAHVGLIGLPNTGKSTLLRTLTNAQVKIGDYAFTTLFPQVGIMEYDDYTQVAISDLPGLIEDSHKNRGLGLKFLRHVQHCACLLYVVDLTDNPILQLETLFQELDLYRKGLSHRPHLILGNKIDDPRSLDNVATLKSYLDKVRPESKLLIASGLRGDSLDKLRVQLRDMYDAHYNKHKDDVGQAMVW